MYKVGGFFLGSTTFLFLVLFATYLRILHMFNEEFVKAFSEIDDWLKENIEKDAPKPVAWIFSKVRQFLSVLSYSKRNQMK